MATTVLCPIFRVAALRDRLMDNDSMFSESGSKNAKTGWLHDLGSK